LEPQHYSVLSPQSTYSHGTVFEGVLTTKQITVLEDSVYSPDLAPSDLFLFPKIKEILKGGHFDDTDDIRISTTTVLKDIP
jgi:hypothetical protein